MWAVVSWWLVLEALGLVTLPLTFALFGPAASYGYPFAKVLGLLLVTYVSWLIAFAVPLSTALAVTLAALAVAGAVAAWLQRAALSAWLSDGGLRLMGVHALLWAGGFLFFVWQRSMAPDIFGAEKYMDFAFLNALARAGTMPPQDPWMSGETINYYYFGYLMFANLVRIAPVPSTISYNLCIATIGGLAFALTAAVVFQLTKRWAMALLGGAMSALIGNIDGFIQVIEKGTLRGMDYWRSSRVVAKGDTINEFPFFSTIHGDLHPHFIVLPVGIMLLGTLLDDRLFPPQSHESARGSSRGVMAQLLLAFIIGAMVAISPWELPAAAAVTFLLLGRGLPFTPLLGRDRLLLGARLFGILIAGYLLFLPFHLGFDAPTVSAGPGDTCIGPACFKIAASSLAQFLIVFGCLLFAPTVLVIARSWSKVPLTGEWRQFFFAAAGLVILVAAIAGNAVFPFLLVLLAGALIAAYATDDIGERTGFLLIAAAVIPLLACEFAYLKDSYGDKLYRMNTVFKLYFQSWTMLAIAAPWSVARIVSQRWEWEPMPRAVMTGLALLLTASVCYPLALSMERMRVPVWTLDGNAYLRREHPDDFAALTWLRQHAGDSEVILEATGNPYSYFARFASNTGLPNVLGWANHEGLWRGHDSLVMKRHNEIGRIYNSPTLDDVRPLLDRYHVRYVIIGDLEQETYQRNGLAKFAALNEVFRSGNTVIYQYQN